MDVAGGPVSLRVWAAGAAGSEITQTLHRAYRLPAGGYGCDRTVAGQWRGPLVVNVGVTCPAPR